MIGSLKNIRLTVNILCCGILLFLGVSYVALGFSLKKWLQVYVLRL